VNERDSIDPVAKLLEVLPDEVRDAAIYCSSPHWFDRELGVAIIQEFMKLNPSAEEVFAELVELPFVFPREEGEWQYIPIVRSSLRSRLLQRGKKFIEISAFLARYLRADRDEIEDAADWQARQLDWQIAYHLAPEHPDTAMERLLSLTERAARANRLADIKVAAEVCNEQSQYLPEAEVAYFRGRYAYARGDRKTAEDYLSKAWERGLENPLMAANAGFLLGKIWRQKGKRVWVKRAESILEESLRLCERLVESKAKGGQELMAQVLNSLAATKVKLGGRNRLIEADKLSDRSLEIGERLQDRAHIGRVLNTQGTRFAKSKFRRDRLKAKKLLRKSLEISKELRKRKQTAQALNSLGQVLVSLGGHKNLREAEDLYRRSLEISEQLKEPHYVGQVLQNLGEALVEMGEDQQLREAEQLFRRSLEIWEKLDNIEGQIHSLRSLGQLLMRLGKDEEGRQLLKQAQEMEGMEAGSK
jgi:tetratricopeptide (TPR) repeat protein